MEVLTVFAIIGPDNLFDAVVVLRLELSNILVESVKARVLRVAFLD